MRTFLSGKRIFFPFCPCRITGDDDVFGMSWGERLCLYNHVSVSVVKVSGTINRLNMAGQPGPFLSCMHF